MLNHEAARIWEGERRHWAIPALVLAIVLFALGWWHPMWAVGGLLVLIIAYVALTTRAARVPEG
jgi:hypothetical protein